VKPLVPVVRPKGLGLGADKSILLQTSNNSKDKRPAKSAEEDELVLKRGSYCMLLGGKHDGLYGSVRPLVLIVLHAFLFIIKPTSDHHNCLLCTNVMGLKKTPIAVDVELRECLNVESS